MCTGTGSSPLTRGKLEVRGACPSRCRLIPAHAGKTRSSTPAPKPKQAHPRSRGENRVGGPYGTVPRGSSPLTRGKLGPGGTEPQRVRLIPAHAGKTGKARRAPRVRAAHPRSRGENKKVPLGASGQAGSSPLTRGKHDLRRHDQDRTGLIPAHAGKTVLRLVPGRRSEAHPRSRGENRRSPSSWTVTRGSSPLTRGKRLRARALRRLQWLIPAHAGKTPTVGAPILMPPAHPHSRGENGERPCVARSKTGSSPLTRGKRG